MFRKTQTTSQLSMYSAVSQHLTSVSYKQYQDKTSWHNIFYREVVCRIDENLFVPLYSTTNGAPNASVRILIGMMILKEANGYSDKKLYEDVRFNLLTRKSLGLVNMDDSVPAESTYYFLRQQISEYNTKNGIDLFEKCFKQITKGQILDFEVSGKSIRMDSKLIGSNIAFYSRYELIHKTLLLFYKNTNKKHLKLLSDEKFSKLEGYLKEKSADTVYRSSKDEINEKLSELGLLIYSILQALPELKSSDYKTLKRVFEEQYQVEENSAILLKTNKEISAKSVQSPHDPESEFRKKNDEKTKGYSHNITETCDDTNAVNLITDVQTAPASKADNDFTQSACRNTQKLLQDKIENVHADGAYHSQDNQDFTEGENINFYLTGFQGAQPRYQLTKEADTVKCFDTKENIEKEVSRAKDGKYRIRAKKGYRYFTDQQIESQQLRREIEQLPKEIGNKRNNVEATIYQLAYPLRKDKTKYRGLFKNKMWAILRSLWVNCVRITNHLVEKAENEAINTNNILQPAIFMTPIASYLNHCVFMSASRR